MPTFNWRPFLEEYSRELLADRHIRAELPESVIQSKWMGFDPASPAELDHLEAQIGLKLPESYTQFLTTSNGWRQSGGFIYEVFPCEKVEWFRVNFQDWIDAYIEPAKDGPSLSVDEHCIYGDDQDVCRFRVEYLQSSLLISNVGDSAVYLLNPEIKSSSGEWEAWFFANWLPGAQRYPSFWDLMQAEFLSCVNLRKQDERRYFPDDGIETLGTKLPGLIQELSEKSQLHLWGQQQRAQRGQSAAEAYTDGTIEALIDAEEAVKVLLEQDLPPATLLTHLNNLASDLEYQWKTDALSNPSGIDKGRGRAEGNREAVGIIRWFMNQ